MKRRWAALLLVLFAVYAHGSPLLPDKPTDSELALLPEYCKVRAKGDYRSPEFRAWLGLLGQKYMGFLHYCEALNHLHRYRTMINDEHRNFYLARVIPEIDYIAKDMPADFPMASEVYLNRGIAHEYMGKDGAAIGDFTKSIDHDSKQVMAYIHLTKLYRKIGRNDQAAELVSNGLQRVPGNKSLQRLYLELGGQEPFPSPDQAVIGTKPEGVPAEAEESNSKAGSSSDLKSSGADIKSASTVEQKNTEDAPEKMKDSSSTGGETNKSKIGSPTNPYCRFCPAE